MNAINYFDIPTLTVTQLNRQIRMFLEQDIGEISVIGELSNFSKPASGHMYFTLKDSLAQLKCAYFRNYHSHVNPPPFTDGQQVIATGLVSLYEARGEYQLIVYTLTPYGLGELYRQYELLKAKLEKLGLFAANRKRPLPHYPQRIAVITSKSGAALHDILQTLARRYPVVEVDIYASEVQGKNAAPQLIKRLQQVNANHDRPCDLIILARGGGSIEDLWAFNDEQLSLAIYNSKIPIVTGIGHESDFTIADFVADCRAATPTAAAETATPNQEELYKILTVQINRLTIAMQRIIVQQKMTLTHLISKLTYPERLIQRHAQTIDFLQRQLYLHQQQRLHRLQHQVEIALTNIKAQNPTIIIERTHTQLQILYSKLINTMRHKTNELKKNFAANLATLHAVSPLATLSRGYAIATYNNKILYDSNAVQRGDNINVQLARGILSCTVLQHLER